MSRHLSMMIRSLRSHWPARKTEWLMTALTIAWGLYVYSHPEIFYQAATREPWKPLTDIAEFYGFTPNGLWGGGMLSIGLLRGAGLFINGAYVRTPIWRLLAAFASMFIFTQVSRGLINSGVPNPGLIVYPWLVAVDFLSAYRAGQDAVYAEMQRRSRKGTISAAVPYIRAD